MHVVAIVPHALRVPSAPWGQIEPSGSPVRPQHGRCLGANSGIPIGSRVKCRPFRSPDLTFAVYGTVKEVPCREETISKVVRASPRCFGSFYGCRHPRDVDSAGISIFFEESLWRQIAWPTPSCCRKFEPSLLSCVLIDSPPASSCARANNRATLANSLGFRKVKVPKRRATNESIGNPLGLGAALRRLQRA